MLFALVYFFSIFGFWVFDFFDFQLQSVSFETGALLISMRWRFLDSLLFFMNAVNFYVPMMNIRPERPEEATNPEILGGNMTQFELKFWPRSSGCFPGSVSESSNRKLLQILDEIYYVCFGALMISIFFFVLLQLAMAYADRWLAVCLHLYICISFCLSYSLQAQYVAKAVERLQVHSGICGYVLDSHPTHAKSVDHEMNSHKYNGGKSKEQPPEKQKQKEPQTL